MRRTKTTKKTTKKMKQSDEDDIYHEHGTYAQPEPLFPKLYETPRPNYCTRSNSNTHGYSQGLHFVTVIVPYEPNGSALRPLATFGRCFLLRSDPPNPRFAKKQHDTFPSLRLTLLVPVTACAVAVARSGVWSLCIIHSWLGLGVPKWQCLPFFTFLSLWQNAKVAVRSIASAKPKA